MIRLLAIATLCLLASCNTVKQWAHGKPKKAEDDGEPKQQVIGSIELVNPEQQFVLIRTMGHMLVPAGIVLASTNAMGESAKLKITPERKGTYLAADIVSGTPQKNDVVMFLASSTEPAKFSGATPVRGDITTIDGPPPPLPGQGALITRPNEGLRPVPTNQ